MLPTSVRPCPTRWNACRPAPKQTINTRDRRLSECVGLCSGAVRKTLAEQKEQNRYNHATPRIRRAGPRAHRRITVSTAAVNSARLSQSSGRRNSAWINFSTSGVLSTSTSRKILPLPRRMRYRRWRTAFPVTILFAMCCSDIPCNPTLRARLELARIIRTPAFPLPAPLGGGDRWPDSLASVQSLDKTPGTGTPRSGPTQCANSR